MKPVAILPSLCTLGNAFCGFLAIAKGADAIGLLWKSATSGAAPSPETLEHFHHLFTTGCWLIFLANIFDALDGRLARMTKTTSSFGAMLDSLSDMLTFGTAPALMVKFLFESERRLADQQVIPKLVFAMSFLYVSCAAIRLARFNAETDDSPEAHDFFKGLPSPAAAGFVASGILFYLHLGEPDAPVWLAAHRDKVLGWLLISLPGLALLMVSRVKYVHIVNRYLRGRAAHTYIGVILLVLLLLSLAPEYAVVFIVMGYVLLCPVVALLEKILKRDLWPPAAPTNGEAA